MKIQPLGDRILVEVLEAKEKTTGGIIIPDAAKETPQEGTVIATSKKAELKEGDKILFGKYLGIEITVDDKEYLILKEEDVLAVIK